MTQKLSTGYSSWKIDFVSLLGSDCCEGHFVSPQEQKMQSSPSFGTKIAEQFLH